MQEGISTFYYCVELFTTFPKNGIINENFLNWKNAQEKNGMLLEAEQFGMFLEMQREQRNIDRETLGDGIYDENFMGKVARGERYPNYMVRSRLLARLGESGYEYECFLQPEEYEEWLERQRILDSLDDMQAEHVAALLEQYEEKQSKKDVVSYQFFLVMRLQWMEILHAPEKSRFEVLKEVVSLTIPAVDGKTLCERALSMQELNLILEYWNYSTPVNVEEGYLQLLDYVQLNRFDLLSKAMLGAKIVLYYCRQRDKDNPAEYGLAGIKNKIEDNLKFINLVLDWLRDAHKLFFVMELLELKRNYLCWLLENRILLSAKQAEEYEKELEQTREFYAVISEQYDLYGVSKRTNGYTCFYREREMYCINDVIRARRKMLGISATELEEEGICTKRTLVRVENKKNNIRTSNARCLFERLNLSSALHRGRIVTDKQEVLRWEEEYREALNQRKLDDAEALLKNIRQNISMDILINQQYVFFDEVSILYKQGKIGKEEFIGKLKNALELTIPLEIAMAEMKPHSSKNGKKWDAEKYLTNTEVTILKNIATITGMSKENTYWSILKDYFIFLEKTCTIAPVLSMYGFVMTSYASCIGNEGRYEESNVINQKIISESLRARSASYLSQNMYGLFWNERKQKDLPMVPEDLEWCQNVKKCLLIDIYCKNTRHGSIMRKRLGEM